MVPFMGRTTPGKRPRLNDRAIQGLTRVAMVCISGGGGVCGQSTFGGTKKFQATTVGRIAKVVTDSR